MTDSYQTTCDHCSSTITAASKYCRSCGEPQDWFTDDADDVHPDVRDVYRRMYSRAQAVDNDPNNDPPRSFEHALRLLWPSVYVDIIDEEVAR